MPVHLSEITVKNLLSFGPDGVTLELRPLNVLIGANGCGKSNILSVISLIQAAKRDIHEEITRGGGTDRWFHRGLKHGEVVRNGQVTTTWQTGESEAAQHKFRHTIELIRPTNPGMVALGDESLQHLSPRSLLAAEILTKLERYPLLEVKGDSHGVTSGAMHLSNKPVRVLHAEFGGATEFIPDESVAKAIWTECEKREGGASGPFDPADCEPNESLLTSVSARNHLANCSLFGDFDTSRSSVMRELGVTTERQDFLLPNGRNLGLVLSNFKRWPVQRKRLLQELREFNAQFEDLEFFPAGDRYEIRLLEGERWLGLPSVSDGTLRYLCLLAILLHPSPPPLVMIEEPELGLHPDIIPQLGKLLVEASERTQLIVTTHSDILVDCFHSTPESVVVCEQEDGVTRFDRLNAGELAPWLKKYRLGTLWTQGNIGGNRW